MNLGIAELWSLHMDDARRHLEEALALARRIGRPYLEIGCLGHLALAADLSGSPVPVGLRLSEEAVTIAEEHGWGTHRILAPAVAAGAAALAWLGRLDEAEGWLERVERAQPSAGEFETEPLLHWARAFVRIGQGRFEEALAEFRAAETVLPALAREHLLPVELRAWIAQTQVLTGDTAAARATLAALDAEERDGAGMRLAAAARRVGRGGARGGGGRAGADVHRRAGPAGRRLAVGAQSALGHRPRLPARRGRPRRARRSACGRGIGRAGARAGRARRDDPAVPDHARARTPGAPPEAPHRPRRAAHDHPRHAGRNPAPAAARDDAVTRRAQRRRAPRHALPAQQPQGHRDRRRAVRLRQHGENAPPPHLRQARRPQPQRGGDPRPRARTPRPGGPRPLDPGPATPCPRAAGRSSRCAVLRRP